MGTGASARGWLLEREGDVAAIEGLAGPAVGEGRLAIVEGPAGIGKTVLLEAGCERAATRGVRVMCARASELEREFAYGVVRQLLEPALSRLSRDARSLLFEGAARPAALVLGAEDSAGSDASFAIIHGLYWVVLGLASDAPLLLYVDDVQWSDRPSLRFLVHLARRVEGTSAGIVLGLRTAEPDARDELVDELRAVHGARLLRLAPLSEDAVFQIVRGTLGAAADEGFCAACHRASGGNPLYLRELLRSLAADGVVASSQQIERVAEVRPASVARHVLRRIARVGEGAPALAAAMAVLGDGGRLRHAAKLAGIEEAGELARAMLEMEILAQEEPFRFVHPMVRGAVYANLTVDQRERLHWNAARLLIDEGGEGERVAAHLLAVTPAATPWCVEAMRSAARRALGRGAPEAAVRYLRRALAEAPTAGDVRVGVLWDVGVAEEHSADPAAVEHLQQARALCADPRERALIALDLSRTLETRGLEVEAAAVIRSALAERDSLRDPTLELRLEAAWISAAAVDARGSEPDALDVYARLLADVPEGVAGQTVLALAAGAAVWAGTPADVAVALAERACARGLLHSQQWNAIGSCMWAFILSERYDTAATHLANLRDAVERRGHVRGLGLVFQLQANRAERMGGLAEAESSARLALDIVTRGEIAVGSLSWIVCSLVEVLVERGDLAGAEATLARMPTGEWPQHLGCVATLAARGRLRLAQNRVPEALVDLTDAGRQYRQWPGLALNGPAPSHWRASAAVALHRLGDIDEAQRLAMDELEAARAFGTARATSIALRTAGVVARRQDALALLQESVNVLHGSAAVLERARSNIALGAALRRRGQRVAARGPLRSGLDGAHRCGAIPLAKFAHDDLVAAGARPRREALSGLEALTSSERRVADLAAEGMTNRELAQTLYLSPKTIEMHISRVYRKLRISSRSALAGAMAPSDSDDV